jgi:hypothetical protein
VLSEVVEKREVMKVGDRVRVSQSVVVYHHPQHKKEPFDLIGMEGTIISIITTWQGKPISANLPIVVEFSPKFRGHFRDSELEAITN